MTRVKLFDCLCWVGVALVGVAFTTYGYTSSNYHRAHAIRTDGCLANVAPPAVLVIASDETDRLEKDQPRRWRASVSGKIDSMVPGTRLYFTRIRDAVPAEVSFDSAPCVPPNGISPRVRAVRKEIDQKLNRVEQELKAASTLNHSPIRSTILAIAADHALAGISHREILVASDLLEREGVVSAYKAKFLLPPAPKNSLAGFTIHFSVLRNLRDSKYQTPELVQAWVAWAKAAGAHVEVDARWLGFIPAPAAGGS